MGKGVAIVLSCVLLVLSGFVADCRADASAPIRAASTGS
jgi:hypothetical protein